MRFLQKSLFFFICYTMLVWLPGSMVFSQTTIDTYTTNQATLSAPPSASSNSTGGGDIIGTRRGLVVNHLSGPGVTTAGVAGGGLNFNVAATTPDSRGEVVNTWDGDTNPGTLSPAGLGGVNLTSGGNNAFRLNIFSATAGTEIVLDVYTDGSNASRGAFVLPTVTAPADFYLNFSSDFISTLGTGANFASVGAIVLTVRGTEVSCSINQIVVTFNPPNIPAPTQTDQLILDSGSPGNADAGDKIQYKVNIQNTGSTPATGVQLNVAPDPRTTFVPGSFRSSPLAVPDVYACTGNVGLNVPAASGVKANDFDDNPAGLTITAGTFATTQGGSIMLNADGSFMYTPPAGFTGTDTYSYTLNDANGVGAPVPTTDPGLITITVSNLIWFVDNSVTGPGTGTLSDPFKILTSAATASAVGQVIFVKNTGTNYSTGITLKNNQYLFGSGHLGGTNLADAGVLPFAVAANSKTLPAIGGTRPIITGPTNGITLASGNTIRGLDVGRCEVMKIFGSNFGTLTIGNSSTPDVALSGNISALSLSNGTFAATSKFASIASGDSSTTAILLNTVSGTLASNSTTISQFSAGNIGIDIQNSSATLNFGTTTITKNTNSTVAAITITNSGTGTVAFGSLAITSNSTGLLANNGGTLQISGVTNTISTNLGPALDITSTSFGAGATFSNISCTANFVAKGVNLDNVSGNLTVTGGTLNMGGSAGIGLDINAGTGNISYGGNVAYAAANRSVEITGRTGNTATFSGNINTTAGTGINVANNTGGTIDFSGATKSLSTGANTAVTLASNTGATINFSGGGLVISTSSGTGFSATGGGTVNVTGTGNTIMSGTGTALNVANTTIGASGLTFRSISANGAANGIVLNSTGSSGGLTVTGDGGGSNNGSGGAIQNCTGVGVSLISTSSVSLNYMNIQNGGDDGVRGASVSGFSMNRSTVTNNGNALDESGLDFGVVVPATLGLTGTSNLTNCSFTNNYTNQVQVFNNSGSLTMTVTSCTINGRAAENNNNDGMLIQPNGTASITISVTSSSFAANKGDHFQGAAVNSGNLTLDFKNNTLTGGHSTALGQGITVNAATGVPGYAGTVIYDVDGNNFNGAISNAISIVQGTSSNAAVFSGFVRNNIIGTFGVSLTGSTQANGIYVDSRGNGTHTSSVTGNTIRQCFDRGILLEAGDGSPTVNLTVQSNIIDQQVDVNAREAIQTNFGITSTNVFGVVDAPVVCLQLGGAGALANTFSHGGGAPDDFRLRKRQNATVRLPGYSGSNATGDPIADVVNFIKAQNTGSTGEPGSAAASGGGGGYTGGAACNTP